MMIKILQTLRRISVSLAFCLVLIPVLLPYRYAHAEVSQHTMAEFTSIPINLTDSATPLVMISASNDHQLFFEAYDDRSDLNNDGVIETTYTHSITYYGYFDSSKCYRYDATYLRFEPVGNADADNYCTGANKNYWSGNFLNWASMARIDTIRKILFGGHRRVDTATTTVLERTYLPSDAHSWAKHYDGDDLYKLTPFVRGGSGPYRYRYYCDQGDLSGCGGDAKKRGITICNTTATTGNFSQDITDPPLIKVVRGNYSLWAGSEGRQCTWHSGAPMNNHPASNANDPARSGIYAYAHNPNFSERIGAGNFVARVQVCVEGLIGNERCKLYPGPDGISGNEDDNYKPIGLLQVYGDENQLYFGMVAGSSNRHAAGGVLIRNIASMQDEINVATDGTFKLVAEVAGGPMANDKASGLINAWSLFRIVGYSHHTGNYNHPSGDNCIWGLSDPDIVTADNRCQNWGNPFSEIYLQSLRYLAGLGATDVFLSDSPSDITGLPRYTPWTDPLSTSNYCARLKVINFNSSIASYDHDHLDGAAGVRTIWADDVLPGDNTSSAMTYLVGKGEGIHGNDYFIGEINIDNQADGDDQMCTPKRVKNLGNIGGLCPDSPRLQGSYRIAGLAYFANTRDIRPNLTGIQTVSTYSVSLTSSTPSLAIPLPSDRTITAVTLLPACRNTSLDPDGNCAIVDFKVVSQVVNNGSGIGTGKIYINWEDSEQGGDYDQDMWGTLEYVINSNNNTISITTQVHAQSARFAMGFGYIISGTTSDGFHVHSGINGFRSETDAVGDDCWDDDGCRCRPDTSHGGCTVDGSSTMTYSLGLSDASLLNSPLWYASKWGGFIDSDNDNTPNLISEWDKTNNTTGAPGSDDVPDNYFYASNPAQLEAALNRVFLTILRRSASGTAATVVSNNVSGEGVLYQAFFEPLRQDAQGNEVSWIGTLQALWVDSYGYMREDDGDGVLEHYNIDNVIEFFYDENESRTRVNRFTSADNNFFNRDTATVETIDTEKVQTIWNAREQLDFDDAVNLKTQRPYIWKADGGRYIKTWIDADLDGIVDLGEYRDFVWGNITGDNFGFFDVATEIEAENLVNYIRGVEMAGHRNRTIDYDGDGDTEVMRLGSIINSTPTLVSAPQEAFHLLYRDASYAKFLQRYKNRRHVVYVGTNDGMLRAFNAGFHDADHSRFNVSGDKPGYAKGTNNATEHPLGSEIWAYVPMNLLPHLKWLKDNDYTHVYYVDGKPRVFDAKIFDENDADHPGGWGTILVVGMRLGGGPMTVDTASDGLGNNNTDNDSSDDHTFRSAYVIFDITNPEVAPELLAEFQVPDGSYSLSYPTVITFGDTNKWYLVFGSGPEVLSTASSNTNAKLYALDLSNLYDFRTLNFTTFDTGIANSFVGTPVTVDWDLDYNADTVYFGLVGDHKADSGRLMRLALNENPSPSGWTPPTTFVNTSQPIIAAPTPGIDELGNRWLFFGTGRLYVSADETSTAIQSLYGVMDSGVEVNKTTELLNVSKAEVQTDGTVTGVSGVNTFTDLLTATTVTNEGWHLDLPRIIDTATPATRSLSQSALLGGVLFTAVYQPNAHLCAAEGYSRLYGLYYKTGTAHYDPTVFGTETDDQGNELAIAYIELGRGLATAPAIHSGTGSGASEVSVFTQLSTSAIIRTEAETLYKIHSGVKSWREVN